MGAKIPNGSGGFKDLSNMKRYVNGVLTECEYSRAYINNAWKDVWTNAKPFYIIKDFALVNPVKMGGWLRNNFYAYVTSSSSDGGRLGCTAQTTNNANVQFATAASNTLANIYPWDVSPVPFALEKCNKCRIVIDSMGGTNVGGVTILIGGIQVPHNGNPGTYIIDLGGAVTSSIQVGITAYAWNSNYCNIKELYFYRG